MASNSTLKPTWRALRLRHLPISMKIDRRVPVIALMLVAVMMLVLIVSISYGAYDISLWEVIQTLTGTLPGDHPQARNDSQDHIEHVRPFPRAGNTQHLSPTAPGGDGAGEVYPNSRQPCKHGLALINLYR